MICYNCGNEVPIKIKECDYCGEDLSIIQKAYRLSNRYYNIGLSKAKVRDLTGGIFALRKSLEINKRNTEARNLLGLIYYETGQIVEAISEWVISKHLDPENKYSEYCIDSVQSNPAKLEILSQSIKKYNAALEFAHQGNDDLAIIQLRKVVHLNPNFIKALQLLSLLYIYTNEYDKAYRYLKRAQKIDVSNTTTLRYLREIKDFVSESVTDPRKRTRKEKRKEANEIPQFTATHYKEDKPNVGAFIGLVVGIILGVIASVILIIPTVRDESVNELRDVEVEYNAQLNEKDQQISSVQVENQDLVDEIERLQIQIAEAENVVEEVVDNSSYEDLTSAALLYLDGITNDDLDFAQVAEAVSEVDPSGLENSEAVNLYNRIKDAVYIEASEELYNEGHSLYSSGDYEEALTVLIKSYEYNPTNVNAIYFIGRAYHRMEDFDKAEEYYNILIEDYPATNRAREAKDKIRELE